MVAMIINGRVIDNQYVTFVLIRYREQDSHLPVKVLEVVNHVFF